MSDPQRVALLGYGLAGAMFHAPLIAAEPNLELAMVVTGNPERARRAAAEHPGARVVASADDVLAAADELAGVVIASPNRTHVPLATSALEAGLGVVVDKPLAPSSAEAEELVALAERRGRMLTVFHNRRWDAEFLTARRLVEAGELGTVLRLESRFERFRPTVGGGWRDLADPAEGGGLLLDLGSHLVDQALVLLGPVTHVYGELDRRRAGAAVDDDAFVALRHASGARSHLWASSVAADLGPRMRVLGERAAYVHWDLDQQEAHLRAGRRPQRGERWGEEDAERWGSLSDGETRRQVATEPGAWPRFYAALPEAMRGDTPPPVDPRDAVAGLRLLEAARRSDAEGVVVPL